ncbi:hypothetical protein, partial [Vibrio parahaemolyticus]|uniref:hypothetical protein n=1 Tax=Vibrio parahaemolyticus TaxID=670 RepID=UPI0038919C9C|nr:hypothetical protein [Vibrio parahaemolyticus]
RYVLRGNMKVSELQNVFLNELSYLLPSWKYVKSQRTFKLKVDDSLWHLHVSCINHISDFDAVCDVAVEFLKIKNMRLIVGAELGGINGNGQRRFSVSSHADAISSARELKLSFDSVGVSFLNLYSDPETVLRCLKNGGKEAQLISPLLNLHKHQIEVLSHHLQLRT